MDNVGTGPYARSRGSLTQSGRLLLVLAGVPDMLPIPWVRMTSNRRILAGPAVGRAEDLRFLAELAEKESFTPFIDRVFPWRRWPTPTGTWGPAESGGTSR